MRCELALCVKVTVKLLCLRSDPESANTECCLHLGLLPIKLNVDQVNCKFKIVVRAGFLVYLFAGCAAFLERLF